MVKIVEHDVLGPIMVKFKNRTASCNAVVLQGDNEPLSGADACPPSFI